MHEYKSGAYSRDINRFFFIFALVVASTLGVGLSLVAMLKSAAHVG